MNNNQNYQQPQGQPNGQWQQPSQGWQQPQGFQQPPQSFQQPYGAWQQPQGQPYNAQWQQPQKKGMSTGCIVGLIVGVLFLLMLVAGVVIIFLMGAAVVNSVQSEFDGIGSEFYNTAFELYLGDEKPASSVISLMASVRANNEDEDETNIIKVEIELSDGTYMNYSSYDSNRIPKIASIILKLRKIQKDIFLKFI